MSEYVSYDEVRELSFKKTRDEYFEQNQYGLKYVQKFMPDVKPDEVDSDHEAKRLNGLKSFLNAAEYYMSIGLEPYESEETPGFKNLVIKAVETRNPKLLENIKWPYEFPDKGLMSTHFEVKPELDKGTADKIFISLPDPSRFNENVQKLIAEDQDIFVNEFSTRGKELMQKLRDDGRLTFNEAEELIRDYQQEFSMRKVPMKKSTYEAIENAEMVDLSEGKEPHPEILAIGLVFSGVRNHCTLPIEGQKIINTPDELESIGVPKGSPPVQFKGGLVQTSSGGVKQTGELIDDTIEPEKVNEILLSDSSSDEKRAELEKNDVIVRQEFNHEYVEYATRAIIAKVNVERGGQIEQEVIPVWQREDGSYVSALEEDRDHDGIKNGKYGENLFKSYTKDVHLIEIMKDSKGNPARQAGFKADNATNIFLGTSKGEIDPNKSEITDMPPDKDKAI